MRVGWFHLAADGSDPLPAAGCLDIAGWPAAQRSPWVLLRIYEQKRRPDPAWYAQRVRSWSESRPDALFQLTNEPNLVHEQFGGGPAEYAEWVASVRGLVGSRRIGVGAFSPGGVIAGTRAYSDVDGWDALRPQLEADPRIVAILHVYGPTLNDLVHSYSVQAARLPAHTKIVIGECNFGPGPDIHIDRDIWAQATFRPFLNWLDPRVEAVLYFARTWRDADAWIKGGTPVDGAGTQIEAALRQFSARQDAQEVPSAPRDDSGDGAPEGGGASEEVVPVSRPTSNGGGMGGRTLSGIDVSNHQGHVDWDRVAGSGVRFAFVKASEDDWGEDDFFDRWFPRNWSEAGRVGLTRGLYHFARPSKSSPAESVTVVQRALERVGGLGPSDLVALDIEDELVRDNPATPQNEADLLQWVAEWVGEAQRVFGRPIILYSGHWYMEPHNLEHPGLGHCPLWLASYQDQPPPAPSGWDRLTFWQYTAHGHTPGVDGDCDRNLFFGSEADLRALGAPVAEQETPRVPGDVLSALDRLWVHVGPDVEAQKIIAALKVRLGLQEEA